MNQNIDGEGGRGMGDGFIGSTRPLSLVPRPQSIERSDQSQAGIRGGTSDLANFEDAIGPDCDEIGERPADVDADARHGRKRRLRSSPAPPSVSTTTSLRTESPSRT